MGYAYDSVHEVRTRLVQSLPHYIEPTWLRITPCPSAVAMSFQPVSSSIAFSRIHLVGYTYTIVFGKSRCLNSASWCVLHLIYCSVNHAEESLQDASHLLSTQHPITHK